MLRDGGGGLKFSACAGGGEGGQGDGVKSGCRTKALIT